MQTVRLCTEAQVRVLFIAVLQEMSKTIEEEFQILEERKCLGCAYITIDHVFHLNKPTNDMFIYALCYA